MLHKIETTINEIEVIIIVSDNAGMREASRQAKEIGGLALRFSKMMDDFSNAATAYPHYVSEFNAAEIEVDWPAVTNIIEVQPNESESFLF